MNPHDILGVRPGATRDELRSAWRRTATSVHPDHGGDPETFRRAAAAYARLVETGTHGDVVVVRRLGARQLARRWLRRKLARRPSQTA